MLLLLRYTLLYFIYVLAWGIKNITYGIFFTFFFMNFEYVDWGRVIGYFHSDSNFFKHL